MYVYILGPDHERIKSTVTTVDIIIILFIYKLQFIHCNYKAIALL